MKKNKGFTLIEILIVVSIIGLLASVVLVGLGAFRAGGRDARRIADLRETQKALELFYTRNQSYPDVGTWEALRSSLVDAGIGITGIANDPLHPDRVYRYGIPDGGQNYVLSAELEDNDNPALRDDPDGLLYGVDCGGTPDRIYCVQF